MMDHGPLHGWIRNGPDPQQGFKGWKVYAEEPPFPATCVVVVRRREEDTLPASVAAVVRYVKAAPLHVKAAMGDIIRHIGGRRGRRTE